MKSMPNETKPATCQRCSGTREVTQPPRDYTFMQKLFKTSARQVACPECSTAEVRGVRTHHTTGLTSIVKLTFELRIKVDPAVVITDGGVTGHESVFCDTRFMELSFSNGWMACCGTPGRYDTLFVPAKEMQAVLAKFRLK